MEKDFRDIDLDRLKYVKVTYADSNGKLQEVEARVKFISDKNISVYFECREEFNVNFPQMVNIKFITDQGLYLAQTVLMGIKKQGAFVYFTILPPSVAEERQNRKYYRVKLNRTCILIAIDHMEQNHVFMSRLVDVSAGGVLVHRLESMFDDSYIKLDHLKYKQFNLVLILDSEIVLKLTARYVREEEARDSYRYAFEFINMDEKNIDTISKYVTNIQVEQLKKIKKGKSLVID